MRIFLQSYILFARDKTNVTKLVSDNQIMFNDITKLISANLISQEEKTMLT